MDKSQRKNYTGKDKGVLNIKKMIKLNPSIRKNCRDKDGVQMHEGLNC